ncbi:hypothetical protein HDU84_001024 [Entophlyctis sp. JEL0112]|nr:hypothetical protein HDU84_001024 [Entophlyctis sp. JEL0112]
MKAIKRELKEWERAFVSEHGRKPEKADIAADRWIAKKYKAYAKLKLESNGEDEEKKQALESTKIFNEDATSQSTHLADNAKKYLKPSNQPKLEFPSAVRRHPFNKVDMVHCPWKSDETIVDDEDRAAQEFFDQNYSVMAQQRNAPARIDAGGNFGASQESPFKAPRVTGRLPANFKIRKSTIPAGPIRTDEDELLPGALSSFVKDADDFGEEPAPRSAVRSLSPSYGYATSSGPTLVDFASPGQSEMQDFISRREQIAASRGASAVAALGGASTPVVTQIRVVTPVTGIVASSVEQSHQFHQTPQSQKASSALALAERTSSGGVLELPMPRPPTVVGRALDVASVVSSCESERSDEDDAAVVFERGPDKQDNRKQRPRIVAVDGWGAASSQPLVPAPVPLPVPVSALTPPKAQVHNGFFSRDELVADEAVQDEVVPFSAESVKETVTKHLSQTPKEDGNGSPALKPAVEDVIECVSKEDSKNILPEKQEKAPPLPVPSAAIQQNSLVGPKMFR